MAKYIDADALKEGMSELLKSPWANDKSIAPRNLTIKEALGTVKDLCIDDTPAADVEPVRCGHWLKDDETGNEMVRCSICHEVYDCEETTELFRQFYHYCPNCGAKMDGDEQRMKRGENEKDED